MPEHNRMDATLPSVFAQLTSAPARRVRVLTIVFHPDVERIGERWVLQGSRRKPLVLGRQQPAFVRAGGDMGVLWTTRMSVARRCICDFVTPG